LIKHGARGNKDTLNYAILNGINDKDVLKMLIKAGARGDEHTLYHAIENGIKDKEIFKMLIKAGASCCDKYILNYAIKAGIKDKDVLKLLIDNGAGGTEETFDKVLKIINSKRSSSPKRSLSKRSRK
jgi:hypothetical protein